MPNEPMLQHEGSASLRFEDGLVLSPMRTKEGGGKTAEGILVRPGGMAPPRARTGPYGFDELSLEYSCRHTLDSGLLQRLEDRHGQRVVMVFQPRDERGQAGFHTPESKGGVVTGVTGSAYDADGTDPQLITVTIQPDSAT